MHVYLFPPRVLQQNILAVSHVLTSRDVGDEEKKTELPTPSPTAVTCNSSFPPQKLSGAM